MTECKDCKYWTLRKNHPDYKGEPYGNCRRHAPVIVFWQDVNETEWPITRPDDFCGEGEE